MREKKGFLLRHPIIFGKHRMFAATVCEPMAGRLYNRPACHWCGVLIYCLGLCALLAVCRSVSTLRYLCSLNV